MATNPQHDRPDEPVIRDTLADHDPEMRDLYLAVHALVLETLPDVEYTIDLKDGTMGYGAHQYGADGWGIAGLAVHAKWVSLGFMRGTDLTDSGNLLEGTGKRVRHVKVRSSDELDDRRTGIAGLLRTAAGRR